MGRPTKLTPSMIKKAQSYLVATKQSGGEFEAVVPTIEGLALYLGVTRPTVYDWASQDTISGKKFSYIFDSLKMEQARLLINNSLTGKFNATISKMMLSKHDYIEESKVTQDFKGDVTFVNDVPRPTRDADTSKSA